MAEADVLPLEAADEAQLARAGVKLREARERQKIDRAELSVRTKINERHLAAIEDSDFSALPARIYAVGFARSYASAVGLDSAAIAAQIRSELDERSAPVQVRPAYDLDIEDSAKIPSRRIAWVAAALGVALVAAGAVFWRTYFVPAVELPPVREDAIAGTMAAPELTPAALISPTAESAVPVAPASAPAANASPSTRAASTAVPAPRPATGVQTTPSPVPERLEPLPAASPEAPVASPPAG